MTARSARLASRSRIDARSRLRICRGFLIPPQMRISNQPQITQMNADSDRHSRSFASLRAAFRWFGLSKELICVHLRNLRLIWIPDSPRLGRAAFEIALRKQIIGEVGVEDDLGQVDDGARAFAQRAHLEMVGDRDRADVAHVLRRQALAQRAVAIEEVELA